MIEKSFMWSGDNKTLKFGIKYILSCVANSDFQAKQINIL